MKVFRGPFTRASFSLRRGSQKWGSPAARTIQNNVALLDAMDREARVGHRHRQGQANIAEADDTRQNCREILFGSDTTYPSLTVCRLHLALQNSPIYVGDPDGFGLAPNGHAANRLYCESPILQPRPAGLVEAARRFNSRSPPKDVLCSAW